MAETSEISRSECISTFLSLFDSSVYPALYRILGHLFGSCFSKNMFLCLNKKHHMLGVSRTLEFRGDVDFHPLLGVFITQKPF